jgi:NDP-sugar pyrophosphorylase family protein
MKAVILAGGKGTRLAPYTTVLPKPLVPVGDIPILEIIIRQLIQAEFKEVILMVGYLSELIKAYFIQRPSINSQIKISYIDELTPTGTAGSLGFLQNMDETFLVMNGDILTTLDYREFIDFHKRNNNQLTIATHKKHVKIDLGVLNLNANLEIVGYDEKPEYDYEVSMGIYIYEPAVLKHIKTGEYLDFPTLVLNMIEKKEKVMGFRNDAKWLDIGRIEDFQSANDEFVKNRHLFLKD